MFARSVVLSSVLLLAVCAHETYEEKSKYGASEHSDYGKEAAHHKGSDHKEKKGGYEAEHGG